MARKSTGKRMRFEIFKRDGFRCVYCGGTPNESPLHVDHVVPVAEGGGDEPANLVTACQSCNLGKAAVPLTRSTVVPMDPEVAAEQAEQMVAWLEAQKSVVDARRKVEQEMVNLWCGTFGLERCDADIPGRLLKLLGEWPLLKLHEALQICAQKHGLYSDVKRLQYMYGIIRNWRLEQPDGGR